MVITECGDAQIVRYLEPELFRPARRPERVLVRQADHDRGSVAGGFVSLEEPALLGILAREHAFLPQGNPLSMQHFLNTASMGGTDRVTPGKAYDGDVPVPKRDNVAGHVTAGRLVIVTHPVESLRHAVKYGLPPVVVGFDRFETRRRHVQCDTSARRAILRSPAADTVGFP